MSKLDCDFLHCGASDTLIVMHEIEGRQWGLCGFHDKIVSKNGATIEHERGKDYVFSPVMVVGTDE
jgi:hypothetical protein